jgi:membrane-bound serine protease (ClpP class)
MFEVLTIVKTPAFALSVSSFLTLITVIAFFAYLPKSPVWKQIGRDLRQRSQPTLSFYRENPEHLLGRAGITQTPLRPFGVVEIDGQPVEVLTEGDFLEPGVPVFVTQVEGSRIVVEPKSPVGIG